MPSPVIGSLSQKCTDRVDNSISIHFVNVGQGNAVVIRNQKNANILIIDAGTSSHPPGLSKDTLVSNISHSLYLSQSSPQSLLQSKGAQASSHSLKSSVDVTERKRKSPQSSASKFKLGQDFGKIIVIVSHPDKDHINLITEMLKINKDSIRQRIEHIYVGGNILDYHTSVTRKFMNSLISLLLSNNARVSSAASMEMPFEANEFDVSLDTAMLSKVTILSHVVPTDRLGDVLHILAKKTGGEKRSAGGRIKRKVTTERASHVLEGADDGMVSDDSGSDEDDYGDGSDEDDEKEAREKQKQSEGRQRIINELKAERIELLLLPFMQHIKIDRFFDSTQVEASLEFLAINAYHSGSCDCEDFSFGECISSANDIKSAEKQSKALETLDSSEKRLKKASSESDLYTSGLASEGVADKLSFINDGVSGTDSVNGNSAVVRLTMSGANFIFTGDANGATTDRIMFEEQDFSKLKACILLANHHGSKSHDTNAASWAFVTYPEYVVISAGLHKGYQHPHFQAIYNYLMLPSVSVSESLAHEALMHEVGEHPIIFQNPVTLTGKIVEKMGGTKKAKFFVDMEKVSTLLGRLSVLGRDFEGINKSMSKKMPGLKAASGGKTSSMKKVEKAGSSAKSEGEVYSWIRAMTKKRVYTTTCIPHNQDALMFEISQDGYVVKEPFFP